MMPRVSCGDINMIFDENDKKKFNPVFCKGLNDFTMKAISEIKEYGTEEDTRNGKAIQLYDKEFIIANPMMRHLYMSGRTNNIYATWGEIIWVFAGESKLDPLMNFLLPRAKDYSDDDGETWRAPYGHRLYKHGQIDNILEVFRKSKNSRHGVFTIWQPEFDTNESIKREYGLDDTKDRACSNFGWFFTEDNKFNMKFSMRSNDLIFGASNINIPEWTIMQEFMCEVLQRDYPELEMGYYHHSNTNIHIYDFSAKQAKAIEDDAYENLQRILSPGKVLPFGLVSNMMIEDDEVVTQDHIKSKFKEVYDFLCDVVGNQNLLPFSSRVSDIVSEFDNIFSDKETSFYKYSLATLMYIICKKLRTGEVSKAKEFINDIIEQDAKQIIKLNFSPELDLYKAMSYCKFTPKDWLN